MLKTEISNNPQPAAGWLPHGPRARTARSWVALAGASALLGLGPRALAAPVVSRLTPPSALFTFKDPNPPIIARFLPDQRFDLQATIRPDPGMTITNAVFSVDGRPVRGAVASTPATVAGLPANTTVWTLRAYSKDRPGVHNLRIVGYQSDGQFVSADGNFEIVGIAEGTRKPKNIILLIGDGMGIAHRTAARIMSRGVQQGKANGLLEMDQMPYTGIVMTHSLNSIVTDSAPGAFCYSGGNKANNNQQGVFPDDTLANFDNPRVELIGEYLARTQGKSLGIVTTADVFDATPGAFGSHTQARSAGTGICDGYLDEMVTNANLRVLLGGGRKWFLPASTPGSARTAATDAILPAELAAAWNVPMGAIDTNRDLITDFEIAGFLYVPDTASLQSAGPDTKRLLGLFSLSNMNVAKDKIDKRRNPSAPGLVDDYGFPDQPMLDEMAAKALQVLSQNPRGFVVMIEGASIDKQAHLMDSERWILDTIEFDRAVGVCRRFASQNPDTLIVVTADHECAGINIIGASTVSNASLQERAAGNTNGVAVLRNQVVGTYDAAGFPAYETAQDGYPVTTDPDHKMLIGYAANADRYEDWVTNPQPVQDSQQPFIKLPPLNSYPKDAAHRDVAGGFFVTGQVPADQAAHTASDIPLSAEGPGAAAFIGVMDNTDVFFKIMQAVLGGAPAHPSPEGRD
jgi:alkaline phosphatase